MSTLDDFSPLESRFPKSAPTGAGHEQEMAQLAVNTAQMHVTKRWRFTHFSKLPTTPRVRAPSSPTFAAFGRAWALHLYAGAWSGSVSVYLNLTDVAKEASCTLDSLHCSIITPAGVPARAVDLPGPWVIAGELGLIHSGALLRTDLLEEKKQLMADDTLVIELKMTASWTPSDATPATRTSKDGGLAEDMGRLLDSGCHSDVTLLAEGEQLAAHKAQLAARSPVLKAMFEHPMSEALQGRVLLDDLSAQTLRQLLRFLYTGRVQFAPAQDALEQKKTTTAAPDDTVALLAAADRFQVTELVQLCGETLGATVDALNLGERLSLAAKFRCAALKAACLSYVRQEPARLALVMSTRGYASLARGQVDELLACFVPAGTPVTFSSSKT